MCGIVDKWVEVPEVARYVGVLLTFFSDEETQIIACGKPFDVMVNGREISVLIPDAFVP